MSFFQAIACDLGLPLMNSLPTTILTGITTFIATNIDDFVILLLFFSQVNVAFRARDIVIGQYLGFSVLIAASLPGLLGRLIVSESGIGLMGLIPIALGINRLLDRGKEESEKIESNELENSSISSLLSLQTYTIASITIANGSDNIGVYLPLFASSNWASFIVFLLLFFLLIGVWCYAAYQLTKLQAIAYSLAQYGKLIVPFVLIGLGVLILLKNHTLETPGLNFITLVVSCLYLIGLLRSSQ